MNLIKNFSNIRNLSFFGKISLIHIFIILFFLIYRKISLGYDERAYYILSFLDDNQDLNIDKYFIGPIIIFRFLKNLFFNKIDMPFINIGELTYLNQPIIFFRLYYFIITISIIALITKISIKFQYFRGKISLENTILSIAFFISIPCIFGKQLFSSISLLGVPIVLFSYLLLIPNYDFANKKFISVNKINFILSGALISLLNLFRFDSIPIFLLIIFQYICLIIFFNNKRLISNFKFFLIGFLLFLIPQLVFYIYKYSFQPPDLLLGGWTGSGSGWTDGPSKYLQLCYWESKNIYEMITCSLSQEKFSLILSSFVQNIKELSQAVFSIDSFPFVGSFFILSGFSLKNKEVNLINLCVLTNAFIFSSLSYTLFEIEIRYTLFTSLGLSLYSIYSIVNLENFQFNRKIIKPLFYIMYLISYLYIVFSNKTYSL